MGFFPLVKQWNLWIFSHCVLLEFVEQAYWHQCSAFWQTANILLLKKVLGFHFSFLSSQLSRKMYIFKFKEVLEENKVMTYIINIYFIQFTKAHIHTHLHTHTEQTESWFSLFFQSLNLNSRRNLLLWHSCECWR